MSTTTTTTASDLWHAVRERAASSARHRVEELTADLPDAPRVGDPTSAENLREAMLLARTAVGMQDASTMMFLVDGERLGHRIDVDGTIDPVLAARLYAGGTPDGTWPDQFVREAVEDPEVYAERLLGSPFRVLARAPERVVELCGEAADADLTWARVRKSVLSDLPLPGHWSPGPGVLGLAAAAELAPEREADLLPLLDVKSRPAALRHTMDLEVTCLRHAARIAAPHIDQESSEDLALVWRLGQQLRRVLTESPFLGADAELLNARIQPLLPPRSRGVAIETPADAWWPERFATVDLGEVVALTALARRPRRPELSARVAATVQEIAARASNEDELARERAAAADAMGVGAPHCAPPVLARWLLHQSGAPWLSSLPDHARGETFALLRDGWDRPVRVRWILWGVERELRGGVDPRAFAVLSTWLPSAIQRASGEDRVPALVVGAAFVGAGVLSLGAREVKEWLAVAGNAPAWELGVLRTFAERAPPLRAPAIEALLACAHRDPSRAAAAATALLSLARIGVFAVESLRAWWATAPATVRGDPRLARDFLELDQRERASRSPG